MPPEAVRVSDPQKVQRLFEVESASGSASPRLGHSFVIACSARLPESFVLRQHLRSDAGSVPYQSQDEHDSLRLGGDGGESYPMRCAIGAVWWECRVGGAARWVCLVSLCRGVFVVLGFAVSRNVVSCHVTSCDTSIMSCL